MTGLLFRSAGDVISRMRCERGISDNTLAKDAGLSVETLRDIESGTPPTDDQIKRLASELDVSPDGIRLVAGEFPEEIQDSLVENPDAALNALTDALEVRDPPPSDEQKPKFQIAYEKDGGILYNGDCREVMPELENGSFDLIFADPPFNLDKQYGTEHDDDLPEDSYLQWCTEWIDEAVGLLKPGGSLFVYNLPKWNIHLADYLSHTLTFRDWITVDIAFGLPIPNRLYPSHYSLLYFIKGADPNSFAPPRLPVDTCRHCGGEQPDYGGYKSKLNPNGISLTDVWDDIPPVRHNKYMDRDANQLSIKLVHRVLDMASEEGDRILDPFGGAGTTYAACEIMDREWTGIELHDCSPIVKRLRDLETDREQIRDIERNQNILFSKDAITKRMRYRDEFGFNMDDYDLSESPVPDSYQQRLDSVRRE